MRDKITYYCISYMYVYVYVYRGKTRAYHNNQLHTIVLTQYKYTFFEGIWDVYMFSLVLLLLNFVCYQYHHQQKIPQLNIEYNVI